MARKRRPEPTLADYMAIAIGPALIIVLVGSIAFFLLTLFYSGELAGSVRWTIGCFVVAAVLISRVSINEGAERAAMFGMLLMVVVGLAMVKYMDRPIYSWFVLGVIWAFASQLVWNCTLVDDADDASGEGLLEAAGLDTPDADEEPPASGAKPSPSAPRVKQFPSKKEREAAALPAAPPPSPLPLWKRFWAWWQRGSSRTAPPGIWVIYCSLVALPIFGFGQWFIASGDRAYAFQLMFRYVAAALLLLLTTSFLGLRRYLRQRKLEMPLKMAGVWLGVGSAMVAAILLLALFIPRPNPDYSLAALGRWMTSPKRDASDHAVLKQSTGEGEAESTAPASEPKEPTEDQGEQRPGDSQQSSQKGEGKAGEQSKGPSGQPSDDGKQPPQGGGASGDKGSGGQGDGGQGKPPGQSPGGKSQDGKSQGGQSEAGKSQDGKQSGGGESKSDPDQAGKQPQGEQPSGEQPTDNKAEQDQAQSKQQQEEAKAEQKRREQEKQQQSKATRPGQKPPQQKSTDSKSSWKPSFGWLGTLLKWLIYLAAAIVAIYFLIRYWDEVRAWLARLWQEVLDIWNSLFGRSKQEAAAAATAAEEAKTQPRPFAAFKDPFVSGDAARSKPAAVVQYSFEALEAWAIERGHARQAEETPLEFADRLMTNAPELGSDAHDLATLYARVAYARDPLAPAHLGNVERLWKTLRRTHRPPAPREPHSAGRG